MKRRTLITVVICLVFCGILAGCGRSDKETDLSGKLEKLEEKAAQDSSTDKEKPKKKKKEKKEKKGSGIPKYCISSPADVECETIHVVNEDGSYDALSDALEALNEDYVRSVYDTGSSYVVSNIHVRRADEKLFTFVREYCESEGEVDYVEMRGHSFLVDTGEEIKLSDIIDDEDAFYELLAERLYLAVTEKQMIVAGEYDIDIDKFDAESVISRCLKENTYGWVLDPQGVTFWFENVDALIRHASATVLFSADKEGKVFNKEYSGNVPDEWIMRIPESYSSETYFDCDDNGSPDSIYWYPDAIYQDDGFIDSGIGAKYNGRFFGSDEICPADDMPWSHYSVYLMHKNKQTIMVAQYYEEAEPVWNTFTLTDDFVEPADSISVFPEYAAYSDNESGMLVPTDMSAISVYSDPGGDETVQRSPEYLSIDIDGTFKLNGEDNKTSSDIKIDPSSFDPDELANKLGGPVCAYEYEDYDGDGTKESFVATGQPDDMGGYLPDAVWFISSDGSATKLRTDFRGLSLYTENDRFYMEYAKEKKGFFYGDCGGYGSGWTTFIFSVKDGKPYELDISMNTEGFYQDGDDPGEFYTLTDNFDDGHAYLRTELIYNSKTGQFKKGTVTKENMLE